MSHRQFPDFWKLPLVKNRSSLLRRILKDGDRLLDVGAYNRSLEEKIKRMGKKIVYKSMDMDRSLPHDYYNLDEIDESFDFVLLLEVLEHLNIQDGMDVLERIFRLLNPGGYLVVSVPNIFCPGRQWLDSSHQTAYSWEELGGRLISKDFQLVEMFRSYNRAFLQRLFRIYIAGPIHRYFNVDYAKSLFVIAQRPNQIRD